jgi:uncharacterized coiled-coil protein SlyX
MIQKSARSCRLAAWSILVECIHYSKFGFCLHNLIILIIGTTVSGEKMSLWQDLEGLQRKKTELDSQFHSFVEQVKTLEERMKVVDVGLGIQEDRLHKLEGQLKDKHEAMSKLESRVTGLEKTLKRPMKEPVKEEPLKETATVEIPAKEEPVKEEPEKQPVLVTVEAATSGSQQQQTEEKQREEKKRKNWI